MNINITHTIENNKMFNRVEFKMELHGQFLDYINVLSWILNLVEEKKKILDSNAIHNFMASIEKRNGTAYLIKCQFNTQMLEEETLNIVKYICDGDEDCDHLCNGRHVYTRLIHGSYTYTTNTNHNYSENVQYCFR